MKSETISDKVAACTDAANQGNGEVALVKAEEILKTDANNRDGLLCKGRALGLQAKYDAASEVMQQAQKLSKDQYQQITAHLTIGNLHKGFQKNVEALVSYQQALKLSEGDAYKRYARISHNLIAAVHTQAKDFQAALDSYQAGEKLANNDNERADSFERIASTYAAIGQYEQAAEYALKGLLMQQKAGDLNQIATDYVALGQYYLMGKDVKNAENTFNKLLKFAKDNGGAYYEAKAYLLLGQTKATSNDINAARMRLAEAQDIAKSLNDTELNAEIVKFSQSIPK